MCGDEIPSLLRCILGFHYFQFQVLCRHCFQIVYIYSPCRTDDQNTKERYKLRNKKIFWNKNKHGKTRNKTQVTYMGFLESHSIDG